MTHNLNSEKGPQKLYNIKYRVNLLPTLVGEDHCALVSSIIEKGESEKSIFLTDSIKTLIQFKWDSYAFVPHIFGFFMHIIYILTLTIYI